MARRAFTRSIRSRARRASLVEYNSLDVRGRGVGQHDMRAAPRGGDKRLLKARLIVDGESFGGVIREACRPAERRVRGSQ